MWVLLLAQIAFVGNQPCQDCHRNIPRHYQSTRMAKAGVACERCHGPAGLHIQGSDRLIVPAALEGSARDSVCAQCHLKGEAQVPRQSRSAGQYRPGQELGRYVATFVSNTPRSPVEALNASLCRQKAGPDLWCSTCHDVHTGKTERASACASCHTPKQCRRGPDCANCHMPKGDHRIARPNRPAAAPDWRLRPFSPADQGSRELGIAYAQTWARTRDARQKAESLRLLSSLPKPDATVRSWLAKLKASQ